MKKPLGLSLALLLAGTAFLSTPSAAQRRVVGSDDEDDEDKADAAAEADAEKARSEKDKAKAEEAAKKAEQRKKQAEEKAKAKEAAQKAAEEAEAKRKAEEERKAQEKVDAEKRRLEENQAGRLKTAKATRQYTRKDGSLSVSASMTPGAPTGDNVVEIRLDASEILKVASAKYGNARPLDKLRLVAEVEAPKTGKSSEKSAYLLHPLSTPGSYAFHFTPTTDGEWTVSVRVVDKDVGAVNVVIPVHVGTWPPPDFEQEEENNKKLGTESARSGRRVVGGSKK